EIGCGRVPRSQGRQSPAQLDGLQHRGVINRHAARRRPEDGARRNERRHQNRGYPYTESCKIEAILADGRVRGHSPTRGRDVVVTATVLVIGDDQQRLVPAGAVAQRLVNLLNQHFAKSHVVVGVLAVALRTPTRLEERVGGQVSGRGVGVEGGALPPGGGG